MFENLLANECRQVWRNQIHLWLQVAVQHLSEFREGNHATGKTLNVDQINRWYVHACVDANQRNTD